MVSREFADNVQSGNVDRVRSALLDYLTVDKSFQTFDDALSYASQFMGVVQKYNNEPFETDKEKWDKRYLNRQKADLIINFADERIKHLKEVITFLSESDISVPQHSPIPVRKDAAQKNGASKTGRFVISEKECTGPNGRSKSRNGDGNSSSRKTGKRTISEKEIPSSANEDGKDQSNFPIGTAMIVGGAAVAVAGAIGVKLLVIGAGVVIAGTGCAINAKNKHK